MLNFEKCNTVWSSVCHCHCATPSGCWMWGGPRGGHWPSRPTYWILSNDCWCQLVPTHATKAFWMAGIVVVGWRYRGVVANSHRHWLSPPRCLCQLYFVELVVRCWQGLVATEAELGGDCQKWDTSWSSTACRPVQCGLNGTTLGHSTRLQSSIELMQMSGVSVSAPQLEPASFVSRLFLFFSLAAVLVRRTCGRVLHPRKWADACTLYAVHPTTLTVRNRCWRCANGNSWQLF